MTKKLKIILPLIICSLLILVGCSKEETINNNDNVSVKEKSESEKLFNIYNDIVNCKFRTKDMESALRNPSEYEDKKFTFCGKVIKTKTDDKGIQTITVDTYDKDNLLNDTGSGRIIEVSYNPKEFDNERILEGDSIAMGGKLKGLGSSEEYGDILKFESLSTVGLMNYLSALAIDDYFNSIGVDTKSMNLELLKTEELKNLVDKDNLDEYEGTSQQLALLKTNNDTYWLCCLSVHSPDSISLMSGKKGDDGKVNFEYKDSISFDSYNF